MENTAGNIVGNEKAVLKIDDLTKIYKNGRGVRNISFEIEPGDRVGLLGPNGSGKTTIMKVIMGLIHSDKGKALIFGNDIEEDVEKALSKVGGLIERPALFENMTAIDNLEMVRAYYPDITKQRVEEILEVVGLYQYRKEKCGRFSLGMKQRLGLALAILSKPELVILDEPTNGLDIQGTVEVREIIKKMTEKYGTSFLIASHLAPEIEKTCNKVAVVHEGELLAFETMERALELNPSLEEYFLHKVKEKKGSILL